MTRRDNKDDIGDALIDGNIDDSLIQGWLGKKAKPEKPVEEPEAPAEPEVAEPIEDGIVKEWASEWEQGRPLVIDSVLLTSLLIN
jgi:hypothetical protein